MTVTIQASCDNTLGCWVQDESKNIEGWYRGWQSDIVAGLMELCMEYAKKNNCLPTLEDIIREEIRTWCVTHKVKFDGLK